MQLILNRPNSLNQANTFSEADWFREIAVALFQQEQITLGRASKIG